VVESVNYEQLRATYCLLTRFEELRRTFAAVFSAGARFRTIESHADPGDSPVGWRGETYRNRGSVNPAMPAFAPFWMWN